MKQYIADAFTSEVFAGNPAALCILEQWIPDQLMVKITLENNLAENEITNLTPCLEKIKKLDGLLSQTTAKGPTATVSSELLRPN